MAYIHEVHYNEQQDVLKTHLAHFYRVSAESKLCKEAQFFEIDGITRALSGISHAFSNVVMGVPNQKASWEKVIAREQAIFKEANMPFVWYVDEDAQDEFKQLLLQSGFVDAGMLRGVIGTLNKPQGEVHIPAGFTLELVEDDAALKEFNDLVCATFEIKGKAHDDYETFMRNAAKSGLMYNWLVRKDGVAVSALSTHIRDRIVSFWNGATLPEHRRNGLSTALRGFALQHARSKGCHTGTSYLMSEGLAYGICRKLGYETKWRFHAYIAP